MPQGKSRPKATNGTARRDEDVRTERQGGIPIGSNGLPMIEISFTASDLFPTGDYANVVVGPATATRWIEDTDPESTDHISSGLNKLAEAVEIDVIAEQREIVLTNLQAAATEKLNAAKK